MTPATDFDEVEPTRLVVGSMVALHLLTLFNFTFLFQMSRNTKLYRTHIVALHVSLPKAGGGRDGSWVDILLYSILFPFYLFFFTLTFSLICASFRFLPRR